MKTFKFICAAMVCCALAAGFTSCSKDDDEIGNGMSKPTWVLAQMDSETFHYDGEGRVVQIDGSNDWCSSLSYGKDRIEGYGVTFMLDKGFISGWINSSGDKYVYKYNQGGYLVQFAWIYGDDDDEFQSFLWKNDLITHYDDGSQRYFSESSISYYDDILMNSDCVRTLNALVIAEVIEDEYPWILGMRGYLGKLPIKPISEIAPHPSYPNEVCKIIYSDIDGNGCPAKVSINGHRYDLSWKKL